MKLEFIIVDLDELVALQFQDWTRKIRSISSGAAWLQKLQEGRMPMA